MDPSRDVSIRVGQVWADADPRSSGRKIRITEVDVDAELVRGVVVSVGRNVSEARIGQRTRPIKLARFRPGNRGYRLVE